MKIGLIFLAGGKGARMGGSLPKQFLELNHKPVVHHSLAVFDQIPFHHSVVVVDEPYRHFFPGKTYALPGSRRQDSVWNGLQALDPSVEFVCIHDGARPFITKSLVEDLLSKGLEKGAAASAVPLKFTVKQTNSEGMVERTLDRSTIWEIHTPQVVRRDLLEKGFSIAHKHGLTVTDDVGLVELFDYPVQLVLGSYSNLKLTTQEDMAIAKCFIN